MIGGVRAGVPPSGDLHLFKWGQEQVLRMTEITVCLCVGRNDERRERKEKGREKKKGECDPKCRAGH